MRPLFPLLLMICFLGLSGNLSADPCPQDPNQHANEPVPEPNLAAVGTAAQAADAVAGDRELSLDRELLDEAPVVQSYIIAGRPPLEWENKDPDRRLWSDYVISAVNSHLSDLDQARDIGIFCPNYPKLSHDQRVLAWSQIFVGISRWESSWDPTERTLEDQGIDVITKKPVYSEGLLQLSYQDITGWDFCHFDWKKDKDLSSHDWHRTIFNPFNNLNCGIGIMAQIVHDKHSITHPGNEGYWATVDPHDRNGKIVSISAEERRTLPFCGPPIKGAPLREDFTRFANLKMNRDIVNTYRGVTGKLKRVLGKKKKPQPAQ